MICTACGKEFVDEDGLCADCLHVKLYTALELPSESYRYTLKIVPKAEYL